MSKKVIKILVDEMDDGMDEKLRSIGYDAFSVKKLRASGLKLHTDFSIINYAMENKMILVTRDTESGQACEENNIPCILLDSEEIFKIVVGKLQDFNLFNGGVLNYFLHSYCFIFFIFFAIIIGVSKSIGIVIPINRV